MLCNNGTGRRKNQISINRCIEIAKKWLPLAEYKLKKVYFIYDGNAGSFAEQGNAFFNLCSEVISKQPVGKHFKELDKINVGALGGVIAHELHHVMVEPVLFPSEEHLNRGRIIGKTGSRGIWLVRELRCNAIRLRDFRKRFGKTVQQLRHS